MFIYRVKKKMGLCIRESIKSLLTGFLFISWIDIQVSIYFKKLLDSLINPTHQVLF